MAAFRNGSAVDVKCEVGNLFRLGFKGVDSVELTGRFLTISDFYAGPGS